ncbi:N-acyl-D-amino-acid deacylase family protein [Pseudactinotalea sp.]|uniref:N-acyl-D-amino-acid deacylase family protein n=1 Tax=Pseudactinotalea sp. TaxID=1926260 RepID=UPI003B3B27FF
MSIDLLLRGGTVVDGSDAHPQVADIGVLDGEITAVGDLAAIVAGEIVDATGMLVMPGFIDAHSHTDVYIVDPMVQHALLRQGVTTVITGQDGVSHAGAGADGGAWGSRYFAGINGVAEPVPTLAEYRKQLTGRLRVNTAHLLPHGSMRYQRAGLREQLEPSELKDLRGDLEAGLEHGAVGLSTGLHYLPGIYGDVDEFATLAAPLAAAGRPYVTHMRGYEAESSVGMAEVVEIARRTGVGAHVSHLHGPATLLLPEIAAAEAAGVDLTFDSYPYLSGFSLLTVPLLPWELLRLSPEVLAERLSQPGALASMPTGWSTAVEQEIDRITLAGVPGRAALEGLTLRAAAAALDLDPATMVLDLIASTKGAVTAVFAQPATSTEGDVRALLRHPAHMGGSDGIVVGGHPHPRAWGTFARYLARHVRELGDWDWAQAAVHLAAAPGERFGLGGRGQIRAGAPADLLLVDPDKVTDVANYDDPRRLSVGIDDVWVGGVRVLRAGALTDATPGRPLTWHG